MYDVLQSSHETRRVRYICEDAPLTEAMRLMAQGEISGSSALVVQDKSERIVGIMTTKDVIKTIMACGKPDPFDGGALSGWNQKVKRVMTPSKDLVFLEPNGTLEEARALLALSGRRHLPILSGSTLLGVIAPKDLAKHLYLQRPEAQSAKYSSLQLSSHRGLPLGTRLHAPLGSAQQIAPIAMRSGVCSLPHPGKGTLGEDAFLLGPHLVGVADGVGSWWEHGIDPAKYALAIMHACRGECASQKVALELQPQQVLLKGWHRMQAAKVVGSSTVCLLCLHAQRSELLAANVGDSGFLILRRTHAPSTAASPGARGTLGIATREPCSLSATGFEVCFRSPQQLRSFNAPFQLGLAPEPPSTATRTVSRSAFGGLPEQRREEKRREEKRRAAARCRDAWFETPHDASLVRVPIKADDLVVLATDGLFDNMPESEVLRVVAQHAEDSEEQMAAALAERARELSLLHDVDSPFAILAKDNDIMWGGGRPDDITVLVSRVVECAEEAPPPDFPAFTGPGKVDEALAKALAKVEAATPFEADPEFDWD